MANRLVLTAAVLCLTLIAQSAAATQAVLQLDASKTIGVVNDYFYGTNGGPSPGAVDYDWNQAAWDYSRMNYQRMDLYTQAYAAGLVNGVFEHGPTETTTARPICYGCGNPNANWWFWTPLTGTVGAWGWSSDAHSGISSINLTNNATSGSFNLSVVPSDWNLPPGHYEFSAWLKTKDSIGITVISTNGGPTRCTNATTVKGAWAKVTCYFDLTSDSPNRLSIGPFNPGQQALVDDAMLTHDGSPYWAATSQEQLAFYRNITRKIESACQRGTRTLGVAGYMPPALADYRHVNTNTTNDWCASATGCTTYDYDAFGRMLSDYVGRITDNGRLAKCLDVEVWNEPDCGALMTNVASGDAQTNEYLKIYNASYTWLKKTYPDVQVGGPAAAFCSGSLGLTTAFISNFSNRMDFLSYHRYDMNADRFMSYAKTMEGLCGRYNANCNRILITEWNLAGASYLMTTPVVINGAMVDSVYATNTSQFYPLYNYAVAANYVSLLNYDPQRFQSLLFLWSCNQKYDPAHHCIGSYKWDLVSSQSYDDATYAPYWVTSNLTRVAPPGAKILGASWSAAAKPIIYSFSEFNNNCGMAIVNQYANAPTATLQTNALPNCPAWMADTQTGQLIKLDANNPASLGTIKPNEVRYYLTPHFEFIEGTGTIKRNWLGEQMGPAGSEMQLQTSTPAQTRTAKQINSIIDDGNATLKLAADCDHLASIAWTPANAPTSNPAFTCANGVASFAAPVTTGANTAVLSYAVSATLQLDAGKAVGVVNDYFYGVNHGNTLGWPDQAWHDAAWNYSRMNYQRIDGSIQNYAAGIIDGGFEAGRGGVTATGSLTKIHDFWNLFSEGGATGTYQWSSDAHSGRQGLYLKNTGASGGVYAAHAPIVLAAGNYRLSAWVKTSSQASISAISTAEGQFGRKFCAATSTVKGAWTQVSCNFTLDAPNSHVRLTAGNVSAGSDALIDDVTVTHDGAPYWFNNYSAALATFNNLTTFVENSCNNGTRTLVVLGYMPMTLTDFNHYRTLDAANDWCGSSWSYCVPYDYGAWGQMVKEYVGRLTDNGRLSKCVDLEVWNEPESHDFFLPKLPDKDPKRFTEYAKLYDAAYKAIKQAYPDIQVGGPTIAWSDGSFAQEFVKKFASEEMDFISYHCYPPNSARFNQCLSDLKAICRKYNAACNRILIDEWNQAAGPTQLLPTESGIAANYAVLLDEDPARLQSAMFLWTNNKKYDPATAYPSGYPNGGYRFDLVSGPTYDNATYPPYWATSNFTRIAPPGAKILATTAAGNLRIVFSEFDGNCGMAVINEYNTAVPATLKANALPNCPARMADTQTGQLIKLGANNPANLGTIKPNEVRYYLTPHFEFIEGTGTIKRNWLGEQIGAQTNEMQLHATRDAPGQTTKEIDSAIEDGNAAIRLTLDCNNAKGIAWRAANGAVTRPPFTCNDGVLTFNAPVAAGLNSAVIDYDTAGVALNRKWHLIALGPGLDYSQCSGTAYAYNPAANQYVRKNTPVSTSGAGAWFKPKQDCTAVLNVLPSQTIALQPGWNLVGVATNAFQAGRTTDCKTLTIYEYAGNAYQLAATKDLSAGKGYWMYVRNACTLQTA